jgi:ACS family hexuronate transporter-like MFS transporter
LESCVEMGKDLGMDEADYAIMLNIFMITYAAGKFYLENCTIWLELVWVYTVSIILWSSVDLSPSPECYFH